MSIEAMNWALNQTTGSAAAKSVLLVLANRSDHQGKCWPGIDGISDQTEVSRRTVIRQIHILSEAGFLSVIHRGGSGEGRKSNVYQLHIGGAKCRSDTLGQCDTGAGQCDTGAGLSATVTPEPSINPKKNPKSLGRATRLPNDFELTDERRLVAEAETLPAERTFEKFRDYWLAAAGAKARKHDWDATWRNWCRNEADRFPSRSKRKKSYAQQLAEDLNIAANQ